MNRLRLLLVRRSGSLFLIAGSIVIFLTWRVTGMPLPGTLGRLIPLAWLIAAISYGPGKPPVSSIILIALVPPLTVFWAAAAPMFLIVSSLCLLALFPILIETSRRSMGLILAVLPLVPLILVLVPFTGDEPHYAEITESLFPGDDQSFAVYSRQSGDPSEGISHHQSLFPALLMAGYPLGIDGLRTVSLLFAVFSSFLFALLLRMRGIDENRKLAALLLLLPPGSALLGLVYPGWLASLLLMLAVFSWFRYRKAVPVLILAGILVAVKFRFAGMSLGLLVALTLEYQGRRRFLVPTLVLCAAAAALLLDLAVMDGRVFWVRYGNMAFLRTILVQPLYRLDDLLLALWSTLLDVESGLLWKAPWVLAGLAGLPALRREHPSLFRWFGLPSLFYLLLLVYWAGPNWNGSPTPVGRMLLPLVPLLLASTGMVLRRRGVSILLGASLAISALFFCFPELRFNFADGTDVLISRITAPGIAFPGLLPSSVRPVIVTYLFWTIICAVLIWLIHRNSRLTSSAGAVCLLFLFLLGGRPRMRWEAEDLPSEMVSMSSYYPEQNDVDERKYWFFSTQRMLRLSDPESTVEIGMGSASDGTAAVEVLYVNADRPGETALLLSCGRWSDTCFSVSDLMDPPEWATLIRDVTLSHRPENLQLLRFRTEVPLISDTLLIRPLFLNGYDNSLRGIYLDRITIK